MKTWGTQLEEGQFSVFRSDSSGSSTRGWNCQAAHSQPAGLTTLLLDSSSPLFCLRGSWPCGCRGTQLLCGQDAEGPHPKLLADWWLGCSFRVTQLESQAEKNLKKYPKPPILLNKSPSSQKITTSWIILRSTESQVCTEISELLTFPTSCLQTSRQACRCTESLHRARWLVKLILLWLLV